MLKQHDHAEVQWHWQRHTSHLPWSPSILNDETIPPAVLSSTIPTFKHYKKLLALQKAHFTAFTTFILRSDIFWTTNHTRFLWKQLSIILSLRSQSLDTCSLWTKPAQVFKSIIPHICCVEKFSVCPYTGQKILILINIWTQFKNILNLKPQTNRKSIACHYTDIYSLYFWHQEGHCGHLN